MRYYAFLHWINIQSLKETKRKNEDNLTINFFYSLYSFKDVLKCAWNVLSFYTRILLTRLCKGINCHIKYHIKTGEFFKLKWTSLHLLIAKAKWVWKYQGKENERENLKAYPMHFSTLSWETDLKKIHHTALLFRKTGTCMYLSQSMFLNTNFKLFSGIRWKVWCRSARWAVGYEQLVWINLFGLF